MSETAPVESQISSTLPLEGEKKWSIPPELDDLDGVLEDPRPLGILRNLHAESRQRLAALQILTTNLLTMGWSAERIASVLGPGLNGEKEAFQKFVSEVQRRMGPDNEVQN